MAWDLFSGLEGWWQRRDLRRGRTSREPFRRVAAIARTRGGSRARGPKRAGRRQSANASGGKSESGLGLAKRVL